MIIVAPIILFIIVIFGTLAGKLFAERKLGAILGGLAVSYLIYLCWRAEVHILHQIFNGQIW